MDEYFIAVDIGGTNLRFALVDKALNIVKRTHLRTGDISSRAEFLEVLSREIKEISRGCNAKKVAIILPAPYKKESTALVDVTFIPCIEGLEYSEIKSALSGYVVSFENDVNVIALLESKVGVGKGSNCLVYITFSTGVGSGIVVNGEIHNGANGYAGEIGAIIIDSTKENFLDGTFENLCSGTALTAKAEEVYGLGKTSAYIFEMYQKNDVEAVKIINEWVKNASTGIANAVQILDPDVIVLGGPLILCNSWITEMVYESTKVKLFGSLSDTLKIETTVYGSDAGLLGAAYYSITN